MKICDLTYAYSRGGGITTYINNKKTVYNQKGIEHIIISPREDGGKITTVTQDGLAKIYLIPGRKIKLDQVDNFFYRQFSDIKKIINQEKPDVLEVGDSFTAGFYGSRLRRLVKNYQGKIFFFAHERLDNFYRQIFPAGWRWLGQLIAGFLRRRFITMADGIIANSDFTAQESRSQAKKPVSALALGIDLAQFKVVKDQKLYNQLSDGGKKEIIIHVGRLERDKKIELLLKIAQSLDHNKYQLVLIGDGIFRKKFAVIPRVTVTDFLPPPEVRRYLAVADLGILVNDIEPYGLVGLEMMATGLPILGPNQGGLTTFLRPEFAWLLPHQAKDYLNALAEWENFSPEKRTAMSQAAWQASQKYTIKKMVDNLLTIYQNKNG